MTEKAKSNLILVAEAAHAFVSVIIQMGGPSDAMQMLESALQALKEYRQKMQQQQQQREEQQQEQKDWASKAIEEAIKQAEELNEFCC